MNFLSLSPNRSGSHESVLTRQRNRVLWRKLFWTAGFSSPAQSTSSFSRAWISCASGHVGSFSHTVWLSPCLEETACGGNYCVALGRLTGMCCNEVVKVVVNDTIVILICTTACCGIWVYVDFRFSWVDVQCLVNELHKTRIWQTRVTTWSSNCCTMQVSKFVTEADTIGAVSLVTEVLHQCQKKGFFPSWLWYKRHQNHCQDTSTCIQG